MTDPTPENQSPQYQPQGAPHQFPGQHPFAPQPKKKRGCLWAAIIGLGAFMLLTFVGCVALVAGSGADGPSSSSTASAERQEDTAGGGSGDAAENDDEAPTLGDRVEDGDFAFTVTDVETGVESVGGEYLSEEAHGQFVIVHVTVENIGDKARYFEGSNQKLYDADGKEYSNDTGAEIYLGDSESFLNEINPGNKVDAKIVYDIPEDVVPDRITLSGSLLGSGGVAVKL